MLSRRLMQSLVMACLTLTLHGHGLAQAAVNLPPEMKTLLQDLQKGAGDWLNATGAQDPEAGSTSESPQAPVPGGYEDAIVRYQNLLDLVNRLGSGHPPEPAWPLPLPEPQGPATPLPSAEMPPLAEATSTVQPLPPVAEHPTPVPGADLSVPATAPLAEASAPQAPERSERLMHRLEALAGSLGEVLQQLRDSIR